MARQWLRRMGVGLLALATVGLAACEALPARQGGKGAAAGVRYGQYVAMSGNGLVMAISAPNTPVGGSARVGEVEIWEREAREIAFSLTETIAAPTTWADQYFGMSLDLNEDGTILAIGAPSISSAQTGSAGRAYVFARTDPYFEFNLASTLVPTPEIGQRFGAAIALNKSGSRLVVGAPRASVGGQTNAGSVYVYDFASSTPDGTISWTKRSNVTDLIPQGSNAQTGAAEFGSAIDLDDSGNTMIVGAPYYNAVATNDGIARVFTWTSATSSFAGYQPVPVQVAAGDPDIRGANAFFGRSVAISGDGKTVVVGFPNRDTGKGGLLSATFDSATNSWIGAHSYKAATAVNAGASVDLNRDGTRAVIGIPLQKDGANAKGWIVVANPLTGKELYSGTFSDYSVGDDIGRTVAISDAGHVFVTGAPAHDSSKGRYLAYDTFVPPSEPLNPQALALNGAVILRWTPPANVTADLSPLYSVTSPDTPVVCSSPLTTCTFTGLTNGKTYNFKIVAGNAMGLSQEVSISAIPFNWATVGLPPRLTDFADLIDVSLINPDGTIKGGLANNTTGAAAVPPAPTGVVAVAARRKIAVTWDAAPASDQPVLLYTVTATSPKGTKTCTAEGGATSCVLAKLGDNKAYTVTVTATNAIGTGEPATVAGRLWTQPKISRGTGATLKHLARHAGMPAGKKASVTVSLRGATAKANCAVVNGRVFAKVSGPCKVRIVSKVGSTVTRKTIVVRAVR